MESHTGQFIHIYSGTRWVSLYASELNQHDMNSYFIIYKYFIHIFIFLKVLTNILIKKRWFYIQKFFYMKIFSSAKWICQLRQCGRNLQKNYYRTFYNIFKYKFVFYIWQIKYLIAIYRQNKVICFCVVTMQKRMVWNVHTIREIKSVYMIENLIFYF